MTGTNTLKTLYKISTFLILGLGVLHISLTPVLLSGFTQNALWFASGGVMIVFASFFNLILMKTGGQEFVVRILCHSANVVCLIFAALMFVLDSIRATPEVQSWFVLFLFFFESVAAFWLYRR